MRYLGDRWADEDRKQTARGYTLFSSTTRYRYKDFEAFLSVENLTNTDWREAQFYFTSRLAGEPAAGRERHPLHTRHSALLHRRHRLAFLDAMPPLGWHLARRSPG